MLCFKYLDFIITFSLGLSLSYLDTRILWYVFTSIFNFFSKPSSHFFTKKAVVHLSHQNSIRLTIVFSIGCSEPKFLQCVIKIYIPLYYKISRQLKFVSLLSIIFHQNFRMISALESMQLAFETIHFHHYLAQARIIIILLTIWL